MIGGGVLVFRSSIISFERESLDIVKASFSVSFELGNTFSGWCVIYKENNFEFVSHSHVVQMMAY